MKRSILYFVIAVALLVVPLAFTENRVYFIGQAVGALAVYIGYMCEKAYKNGN